MRSSITTLLLPALVAASSLGYAADTKLSRQDAKAIQNLAEANRAEVESGKLALQKAKSDDVKKFAQHMVDDHGRMLDEVQQLAQSKGVKLPDGVGVKDKAQEKKLEMTSADKFDKDYMAAMVKDHQSDLKELQKISKNAKDPDLRAAADKAMATVKQHFDMAKQISSGPRAGK